MICCTLLNVHSSFAIVLIRKRVWVALLSLSSWCLVKVVWLFLAVPWGCLQFVIVVLPDHTHLLISICNHLDEEEKAGCFAIIVLKMYCYYKCYVALPHGAVGWSAVYDFGIS